MSYNAFNLLSNTLRPHILKEDTRFRKCIPAEIKFAARLYYLSRASDYRTIANLSVSGFPKVVASIDCCHIRIKAPNKKPL